MQDVTFLNRAFILDISYDLGIAIDALLLIFLKERRFLLELVVEGRRDVGLLDGCLFHMGSNEMISSL